MINWKIIVRALVSLVSTLWQRTRGYSNLRQPYSTYNGQQMCVIKTMKSVLLCILLWMIFINPLLPLAPSPQRKEVLNEGEAFYDMIKILPKKSGIPRGRGGGG